MSAVLLANADQAHSAASSGTTGNTTNLAIIWGNNLPECANPSHFRTIPGIIRNCSLTVVACIWAAQHPNVPNPRRSRFENWKEKSILVFFAFACPEISVVWAYRQWVGAARHRDEYNSKFGLTQPTPLSAWSSRIKSWFNNQVIARLKFISGYGYTAVETVVGKGEDLKEGKSAKKAMAGVPTKIPWTLTHGFLLEMGGLVIQGAEGSPLVVRDVSQLEFPLDIPEALIQDKSVGDTFGKFLAVAQTMWFMIQCITRWIRHLTVTELEVLTIGLAFLNAFTYIFWLSKPQNMYVAFSKKMATRAEYDITTRNRRSTTTTGDEPAVNSPWFLLTDLMGFESTLSGPRSHLYYTSSLRAGDEWKMALQLGPVIILFGAIHLIPIFLGSFPTPLERYIWAATVICISAQPVFILGTTMLMTLWQPKSVVPIPASSPFVIALCILCLLARQALPFLAFVTLRSPPNEAYYNVDWVSFIPHL